MNKEYKQLKEILREYGTTIFGAETNYNFVSIGNKDTYYKYSIRNYNNKNFTKEMETNYIFADIVWGVIKSYGN